MRPKRTNVPQQLPVVYKLITHTTRKMIKYIKGNSDQVATVFMSKKKEEILLLIVGVDFILINEKYDCCNEQIQVVTSQRE